MDEYKIKMFSSKTKKELKDKTNKIIDDLSFFGRSVYRTDHSNRFISRRMQRVVQNGIVTFGWNAQKKRSVVAIHPGFILERMDNNHIKIRRR